MSVAEASLNRQQHAALPAQGVWSPVLTPLKSDLSIDSARFTRHARWLLEQGCHGLALFGTTSEANSFSVRERQELLDAALAAGLQPERLMVGTGCAALTDSVELTRHAAERGCKKVLMLPPFYYKGVSDEGLYRSFATIIERVGDNQLSVFLYHIPQVSAVPITLGLIELLLAQYRGTVVGVKDSSGDMANTTAMIDAFPDLAIFPGSERLLLDGLRARGAGCITATANVNPRAIRDVYDAWEHDAGDVDARQGTITAIRNGIEGAPVIPAMKCLLAHLRDDPAWREVRPPMVALESRFGEALAAKLAKIGFSYPD